MPDALPEIWDLVWANPAEWWDDQLELADCQGGEAKARLLAAHDKVCAAGCLPVNLYTALRRLQKSMEIPAKIWRLWHDRLMQTSETLWWIRAADPEGPLTQEFFQTLRTALGATADACKKQGNLRAGQKSGGRYAAIDACLDDLLERTGDKFPADELATLITQASGVRHTGSGLRMLRSRKRKTVNKRKRKPLYNR